jgi:hypothetical protein
VSGDPEVGPLKFRVVSGLGCSQRNKYSTVYVTREALL